MQDVSNADAPIHLWCAVEGFMRTAWSQDWLGDLGPCFRVLPADPQLPVLKSPPESRNLPTILSEITGIRSGNETLRKISLSPACNLLWLLRIQIYQRKLNIVERKAEFCTGMCIKGFVFTIPVPSQLLAESVARRDLNFFFLFFVFTEIAVRMRRTQKHLIPLITQSGKVSELQFKSQIPKEIGACPKAASQKR